MNHVQRRIEAAASEVLTGAASRYPGALKAIHEAGQSALQFLARHAACDWGDLDDEDKRLNDEAIKDSSRLLSAYTLRIGQRIWIITEAADDNGQRASTCRRVQQIVKKYAAQAGVRATPHVFRHQAITWLTRHSGLADAELQLLTGHARRETLAVYQHVALDGALEAEYHETMKQVEL